ncbi:MAG: penicillin-binding protein activator LpoB [Treponema sp.]|nr:penicillin-binding protein activator LpoB [Treponema sp.]
MKRILGLEDLMKNDKICLVMALIISAGLMVSCASVQDRTMTPQERAELEVVGTVTASWTSFSMLHIPASKDSLKTRALSELKKEAAKQGFSGNIDFRNISVTQGASPTTIWLFQLNIFMDIRKNTASADIVLYSTETGRGRANQQKMGAALDNATQSLIESLPRNSTIAILNISSSSRTDSEYIVDELEYRLVGSGRFTIVDRRRLDQIRSEQNFQMTGEVDDNSAISIGNMLGANIVITGNISSTGTSQYLNLKALDVKTARIITLAREQY